MKTQIDHFYWVASSSIEPGVPAYHVQVVDVAESMEDVAALGGIARRERVLNMSQAKEAGIKIEALKAYIDSDLALRVELQASRIAALEEEIEELTRRRASPGVAS